MFSSLGELVPAFWLMELDLVSLKDSAVYSSRFWDVYGFSMALGSPSGFGSVRHVYFHSHYQSGPLSISFTAASPLTCPWNLCWFFCSPVLLCIAGQNLLVRGLSGSFLRSPTLPSVSLRIVWDSLACWACPLCHGACVHLSQLPGPAFCIAGLVCTCLDSLDPPFTSQNLCVLSVPGTHFLCHWLCVCWRGLYATPLLVPQARPLCCVASVGFSRFPKPDIWLGPSPWVVMGWEVQFSLFHAF